MVVKIYIADFKVDLFKEESISITSSVLDIEDITKNTTDYTKSFTVPATANNNNLFKHYYEANIDNTFDARIKIDGRIELDGMPFRKGKWLLQKVSVKQGNPSSYTINFFGNLISIKDILGTKELSNLDFTALDHDYNSATVHEGLMNGLFDSKIIYNLLVKKQLYYNSNPTDTTQTDKLANIAYNTTSGINGVRYSELRPSIKLLSIIEAIENDYGITFSRDFFGRSEFSNLYLWLNNSDNSKKNKELKIDFNGGSSVYVNHLTDIGEFDTENRPRRWWQLYLKIIPSAGYENVEYTVRFYKDNDDLGTTFELSGEIIKKGTYEWKNSLHADGAETVYQTYYTVSSSSEFKFTSSLFQQRRDYFGKDGSWNTTASEQEILSEFTIKSNMPKIKIIDFLKGLFQTFKLIVIPKQDGTIYVNTLKSYYEAGNIYDLTNYIDFESYDVERGSILNEISYKFQEPTTILNNQFKIREGKGYGDEISYLKDENNVPLDGSALTIEIPFEQFIYDRIIDTNDLNDTEIMYGAIVDDNVEPTNPKPHIFYNIPQVVGDKAFSFLKENDIKLKYDGLLNTCSHTNTFEDQYFSTTFSKEFNEWDGNLITNTIYSNYHNDYINAIFNIKRRSFKFNAKKLPLLVLLKLQLNDVIQIKGNNYRIDKMTTDLVTSQTELNLINSFDFTVNAFSSNDTRIYLTKDAQTYSVFVTNMTTYSVSKINTGFGTDWVSVSDNGTNLIFTVDANISGDRSIIIKITDDISLQEIDFTIFQDVGIITMDSTIYKFDSTLITFDNE